MDAIRVYEKYVNARIRVNQLNRLLALRRNSPVWVKNRRLSSNGRYTTSESCPCNDPAPVFPEKPRAVKKKSLSADKSEPPVRAEPKRTAKGFECKYKRPVIVLPAKHRFGNKEKRSMEAAPSNMTEGSARYSLNKPLNRDIVETTQHTSAEVAASCVPKCPDFDQIPDITKVLCMLKHELQLEVAQEVKQKQQLNLLNDQLKQVCITVKALNEKCKVLETEKKKLTKKPTSIKCECSKKASSKRAQHKLDLRRKASSLCQFCKNKSLPVLSTMQCALFKLMGRRRFNDIALTILLRADDIYHVNVRDLCAGAVLGCLLVTDAGIRETNCLGLFQDILTFCVIDERSTINAEDAIFGCVNFALVKQRRLSGGNALEGTQLPPSNELCTADTDQVSQVDVPLQLVHKKSEPELEIGSKDKIDATDARSQEMSDLKAYSSLVLKVT